MLVFVVYHSNLATYEVVEERGNDMFLSLLDNSSKRFSLPTDPLLYFRDGLWRIEDFPGSYMVVFLPDKLINRPEMECDNMYGEYKSVCPNTKGKRIPYDLSHSYYTEEYLYLERCMHGRIAHMHSCFRGSLRSFYTHLFVIYEVALLLEEIKGVERSLPGLDKATLNKNVKASLSSLDEQMLRDLRAVDIGVYRTLFKEEFLGLCSVWAQYVGRIHSRIGELAKDKFIYLMVKAREYRLPPFDRENLLDLLDE